MARLRAKVSRCEVSSILKNTFSVGICWWNRPPTSFLGPIGYMVRSGAKLFRTKTSLNFASKALSNSFFQKTSFRFDFLHKIAPHHFSWPNGLDGTIGGKSVPEWSFVHPKKHPSVWIFLWKLAIWCVQGQNCSGRKLFSIFPQKHSRIRFSKKHVFGLNFRTKSHLTNFMGQTD